MKSRISSFKLGKELWKKQIWLFALSGLVYFLSCTILGMLSVNLLSVQENMTRVDIQAQFLSYLTTGDSPTILAQFAFATVLLGTAAGIRAFSFLHYRTRTDFYHGLPVSRTRLYLIQAGITLVDYLVPAILSVNLLLGIFSLRGIAGPAAWAAGWKMIFAGLIILLTSYSVSALAILLTGRMLVGILGVGTFITIGPVMAILHESWMTTFFHTYYNPVSQTQHVLWKYSPYAYPWNALLHMSGKGLGISLAGGLVLFAVNLAVYRKRPSEAAETSMVFRLPAAVIQVVLVTVCALFFGIFFGTVVQDFSPGWFAFGLIFGWALTYIIIQVLYMPNYRKLAEGKWRLLASGILVLGMALVSVFDLTGYDKGIPAQDKIADIGVISDLTGYYYTGQEELAKLSMKLPADDTAYGILKKLADSNEEVPEGSEGFSHYKVRIRMKNGKVRYRQFSAADEKMAEDLAGLYDYPEYRGSLNQIMDYPSGFVTGLDFRSGDYMEPIYSGKEVSRREALLDAIKKDLMNVTPDTVLHETPVGMIQCTVKTSQDGRSDYVNRPDEIIESILIYPSFKETLDILKKDHKTIFRFPDRERILKIEIYEKASRQDGMDDLKETVTDPEEISRIMEGLVPYEYDTIWIKTDPIRYADVTTKDGELISCRFLSEE